MGYYYILLLLSLLLIIIVDISLYIYILIISHLPSQVWAPERWPCNSSFRRRRRATSTVWRWRRRAGAFTTKVRGHGSHSELACGELNPWTIQSWSVYTTHHVLTSEIILGIFHILVGGFWLSHPLGILDESKMSVCVVFFLCAAFNPRSALRWPNIPLDRSLITDMRFSHVWVESGKK